MGIVAALAHIILYALCIYALFYSQAPAVKADIGPWPGRVVGVFTLLFSVYLVNAYVVPIPSPFAAPIAENLPNHSPEPSKPAPLHLEAPKTEAPAPTASEAHKAALKTWISE